MSLPWSDIASLGDPAGMRLLAGRLRILADQVTHGATSVEARFDRLNFQGPARERLDSSAAGRVQRARRIAAELGEAADLLVRSAAEVEARQMELRMMQIRAEDGHG